MLSLRPIFRFSKSRRGAWVCIITGLALIALSILSTSFSCAINPIRPFLVVISKGQLELNWSSVGGFYTTRMIEIQPITPPDWDVRFVWASYPSVSTYQLQLPLILLGLVVLFAGLAARVATRASSPHLCSKCGYNLISLPKAFRCPECGAPVPQPTATESES